MNFRRCRLYICSLVVCETVLFSNPSEVPLQSPDFAVASPDSLLEGPAVKEEGLTAALGNLDPILSPEYDEHQGEAVQDIQVGITRLPEMSKFRGLVLVDSIDHLLNESELESIEGLTVFGVEIPGSVKTLNQVLKPVYVDQECNEETVQNIKRKIYSYTQDQERPFVVVSIPPQRIASGVLQCVVEESRLGELKVVGNKWLPPQRVARYFKIKPGDPISQRRIAKDLNFANRNPFRRVDVVYSPGDKINTTDLTIEVTDRKPYRFYAGADNSGVPPTGRQRFFAGFSWDQVFNLDHTFFYQYTTNYDARRFHANTFQYMALLPNESILNFYGGFSILHANLPSPNRKNKGTNVQASVRYHQPLMPMHDFTQEFVVGFDVKNTNNTMEFVDYAPAFGQTVNLTQFVGGYQCGWKKNPHIFHMGAEVLFSPMRWIPGQEDSDFASLRPGAKNRWIYAVMFGDYQYALPYSFVYTAFFRGQWSSQTLLPSEQLGLGGYDTIRGYDQRQYNADNGIYVSQEVHTPTFSVVRSKKPHKDQMYFLAFLDMGYGMDKVPVPGVKQHNYLIGAGPGFRYFFGSYLSARLDMGFKLHHQEDFTGGDIMFHFNVTGSY